MRKIFYLLILFSIQSYSQQIEGYIYDKEGSVTNIALFNKTQNLYATSDLNGYFELKANVGDSIIIESIIYKNFHLLVSKNQIDNEIVIELEPDSFEEVIVNSYKLDSKTMSSKLNRNIKNDIIKNPVRYEPNKGNIRYLIEGLIGLFKKKDKLSKQGVVQRKLELEDLIALFQNDAILNENFLTQELEIQKKYHNLFLDFISSRGLSYSYLKEENKLNLISLIYKYAIEYKSMIKISNNDKS